MAYTVENFQSKKALREAMAAGKEIHVYQPGGFFPSEIPDGVVYLEGPHYPKPHRWYASGVAKNGVLVKLDK